MNEFGTKLRKLYKSLGLSQQVFAREMDYDPRMIRMIEAGQRRFNSDAMLRLKEILLKYAPDDPAKLKDFEELATIPQPLPHTPPICDNLSEFDDMNKSLIGRDELLQDILGLLRGGKLRLLTLTGPPGVGKSRLSLEVAAKLRDASAFRDGVCFVQFDSITETDLVLQTIAEALPNREYKGRDVASYLTEYLQNKNLLLVLNNFDHVAKMPSQVVTLLKEAHNLQVLVTSREPLGENIGGRIEVPPLEVPTSKPLPSITNLMEYSATHLFLERARAEHNYEFTKEDAAAIVEICRRMDGLPLAIELMAVWIGTLEPQEILNKIPELQDLELPTGNHPSIYHAIRWSYDRLGEAEQRLFRRLAVFIDGCSLDAVEKVCGGDDLDIPMAGLKSLIDKHLVNHQAVSHGTAQRVSRYRMLNTIRDFALTQLDNNSAEGDIVRQRHAEYYLKEAMTADSKLRGPEQVGSFDYLEYLEQEHGNLKAALGWSLAAADRTNLGLQLAVALGHFWEIRAHFSDGREYLEKQKHPPGLLIRGQIQGPSELLAKACGVAGKLAWRQGDYAAAEAHFKVSLTLGKKLKAPWIIANSHMGLGLATSRGGPRKSAAELKKALDLFEKTKPEDNWSIGVTLYQLGFSTLWIKHEDAIKRLWDSLSKFEKMGDRWGQAHVLNALGYRYLHKLDKDKKYHQIAMWFEKAKILFQEIKDKWGIAYVCLGLGRVAMCESNYDQAEEQLKEALTLLRDMWDEWGIMECLGELAGVACTRALARVKRRPKQLERAAILLIAYDQHPQGRYAPHPPWRSNTADYKEALRARTDVNFEAVHWKVYKRVKAMTLEDVIAYALEPSA